MELKDTIKLMESEDYKERFKAEYYQTKIRLKKLNKINNEIEAYYLLDDVQRIYVKKPIYDCPVNLLKQQQVMMERYLHLLEIRAEIEQIEL